MRSPLNLDFCLPKLKIRLPHLHVHDNKWKRMYNGRVRERESARADPWILLNLQTTDPHGVPLPMPEDQIDTRLLKYEKIVDSSTGLRSVNNPVDHVKWDGTGIQLPTIMYDALGNPATFGAVLPETFDWVTSHLPSPPTEVMDALAKQAEDHFRTSVKPEVLLYNFVIELIETCQGNLEKAKGAYATILRISQEFRRKYLEFLAKGLSNADSFWLAWNFAIKPFLSDLRKILCSMSKAMKLLKYLIENNGKARIVRHRRNDAYHPDPGELYWNLGPFQDFAINSWDPDNPPWEGGPVPVRNDSPDELIIQFENYDLTYTAQATVIVEIPEYKLRDGGAFLVWESMMGLDRPFAAIWEAIPFSFIIDWFTGTIKDLSAWLDQSVTVAWPPAQILRADHTFKLKVDVRVRIRHAFSGEYDDLGTGHYTRYVRMHGLPYGKPSLFEQPNNVGLRISLSIALVTQRLKKKFWRYLRRR